MTANCTPTDQIKLNLQPLKNTQKLLIGTPRSKKISDPGPGHVTLGAYVTVMVGVPTWWKHRWQHEQALCATIQCRMDPNYGGLKITSRCHTTVSHGEMTSSLEPAQNPDQTPPKTPAHRQAALANPIKPCSGSCRLNVLRRTMEPTLRMPGGRPILTTAQRKSPRFQLRNWQKTRTTLGLRSPGHSCGDLSPWPGPSRKQRIAASHYPVPYRTGNSHHQTGRMAHSTANRDRDNNSCKMGK